MKADPAIQVTKIKIGKRSALLLSPKNKKPMATGILWIHGGGYFLGMKEMVHMSRAVNLVKNYGAVALSPGYRLACFYPYPSALEDCYEALIYMKDHAKELGIRKDQIMVGGESAGGGLCAATCLLARDKKEVNVAFQMPLYPMLDCFDTETSRNNHGKVWNTRRNHLGWWLYLRGKNQNDTYASVSNAQDYSAMPPAYTFVGDGEPFYAETKTYIQRLQQVGIEAKMDVYPSNMHAFDMLKPDDPISKMAISNFEKEFAYAQKHYFATQPLKERET